MSTDQNLYGLVNELADIARYLDMKPGDVANVEHQTKRLNAAITKLSVKADQVAEFVDKVGQMSSDLRACSSALDTFRTQQR